MKSRHFLCTILCLLLHSFQVSATEPSFEQVEFVRQIPIDQPRKVKVDSEGNIYLTTEKGLAFALDSEGNPLFSFGGMEKEEPLVKKAAGIALSKDKVFISDTKLDAILVFNLSGDFVGQFGSGGSDPGELDDPMGLAVRGEVLYVADSDNERVQMFGFDGVFLGMIGARGSEEGRLAQPVDLALDYRGHLYVVDAGARAVKVYGPDGSFLQKMHAPSSPSAITINDFGVYVADREQCTVTEFDFAEQTPFTFGVKGSGRAQFRQINSLFVTPEGHLIVADGGNNALQQFRMNADNYVDFVEKVPPVTAVVTGEPPGYKGEALFWDGQRGRLYASQPQESLIAVYEQGEQILDIPLKEGRPVAVALDSQEQLWVVDGQQDRVVKLTEEGEVLFQIGSSGSREGYFSDPEDLAISSEGMLFIADTDNSRVQAFTLDGVFLRSFGDKQEDKSLDEPIAVSVGPDGLIYVLDADLKIVKVFTQQGEFVRELGGDLLRRPVDLALSPSEILVADAEDETVLVFSFSGDYLRRFGAPGKKPGTFEDVSGVIAQNDRTFLVVDQEGERVQRFFAIHSPAPVSGLSVQQQMRRLVLQWAKRPENYVSTYRVYRAVNDGKQFTLCAEVTEPEYVDQDVLPENSYRYRISSVASKGYESALYDEVVATPLKSLVPQPKEVMATPLGWTVQLEWQPSKSDFLSHYNVFLEQFGKFELIEQTMDPQFLVEGLDSSTEYAFKVTAVSVDEIESEPVEVRTKTLVGTRPPIEIVELQLEDVFSNTYKIYENEGIGVLTIANNTRTLIDRLKVSFLIKEFMDFPTEIELQGVMSRSQQDVVVKAVFNNKILDVTEDTPVQAEIGLSYYADGELKDFVYNYTLNIYEKHRLMWDTPQQFATFVTPKDEVVLEFVRTVVTQYQDVNDPMRYAGVLFNTLGALGMTYIQDPSNPYQETSEKTDFVDYIQYPRETLQRRSGDCDDLVALYAAMLESLGVRTQVVEVPGHMFLMFESTFEPGNVPTALVDLFIPYKDQLWVPVEVTLVGGDFLNAWEAGSRNYHDWLDHSLSFMDIRYAWGKYKPASLVKSEWRPEVVSREELDERFTDMENLARIRMNCLTNAFAIQAKAEPDNFVPLMQIGIIYAEEGAYPEARSYFEKALKMAPGNAAIHNNLGNIFFLLGEYTEAAEHYQSAVTADPDDAFTRINLARTYLKLEKRDAAASQFSEALSLNNDVALKYRRLALELMSPL